MVLDQSHTSYFITILSVSSLRQNHCNPESAARDRFRDEAWSKRMHSGMALFGELGYRSEKDFGRVFICCMSSGSIISK